MEHFDICRETVTRIVDELNLEHNWRINQKEKETICQKYINENYTIIKLAEEMGRDAETISRILHENGIPIKHSKIRKQNFYVYDCNTFKLLFNMQNESMYNLCKELVKRDIISGFIPKASTVWNHIKRNGKTLYKRVIIRTNEENFNNGSQF